MPVPGAGNAASSILSGFLLQVVLVQLLAEGAQGVQDFPWLAPELRKWLWQLGLGGSDVLSVQAKGAEAVPCSGCSWPAVLCVPVFCVTDTRG